MGSAFCATRKATLPSPCPFAVDVNATHGAWLEAVQPHSLATVTVIVPFPPADANDEVEVAAVNWHRSTVEGAVTLVDVDCPHDKLPDNVIAQRTVRKTRAHTCEAMHNCGQRVRREPGEMRVLRSIAILCAI